MLNTQATVQKNQNMSNILQGGSINQNTQNIQNLQTIPTTQNPAIVNNFNIINGGGNSVNNSTIIVEHDKSTNEFTFKSFNKNILGSFNILQLFKFLNNDCESYLTDINIGTSNIIISKYLYNPSNDITNTCDLISHLESPFTGNIELLVKLYADIIKVEDKINEEILTKSRDVAEKIKEKNNKFIYNILIRILKLANTLSEQFRDDKIKREMLIKYSVGSAYKLSMMTQDDITIKKMQYETIQIDIDKLRKIQETINSKLDNLIQTIDTENININILINHLSNKHILHGGDNSTSNTTNTKNTTNTTNTTNTKNTTNTSNTSKKKSSSLSTTTTTHTDSNTTNTSSTNTTNTSDISETVDAGKLNNTKKQNYSTTSISSISQKDKNKNNHSKNISTITSSTSSISTLSELNIKDIQNETNPTENTRSLIKSLNINSSIDNSSLDTFTITQ